MHPAFVDPRRRCRRSRSGSSPPRPGATLRAGLDARACAFADAAGFEPKPGRHALAARAPTARSPASCSDSRTRRSRFNPFLPGTLAGLLPPRHLPLRQCGRTTRGWRRSPSRSAPTASPATARPANEVRLELPAGVDGADLSRIAEAVYLARDLINTPANDMGPAELADAAARAGGTPRRRSRRDRRRRSAGAEFPADPCGRPRRRPARRG